MRCKAKSKQSGQQCKRHAVAGKEVCSIHGGKSLAGIAAPAFKDGKHSKFMPARLQGRYNELLSDKKLLQLRSEVALMDTRITQLLETVETGDLAERWLTLQKEFVNFQKATTDRDVDAGRKSLEVMGEIIHSGANDYAAWAQIGEFIDQRRKLVETERKRMVQSKQMLTSDEAMILISSLMSIIKEEIQDRDVRSRIQSRIIRLSDFRDGEATRPGAASG